MQKEIIVCIFIILISYFLPVVIEAVIEVNKRQENKPIFLFLFAMLIFTYYNKNQLKVVLKMTVLSDKLKNGIVVDKDMVVVCYDFAGNITSIEKIE